MRRPIALAWAGLVAVGGAGLLAAGCTAQAEETIHVPLSDLPAHARNPAPDVWESSPWTGASWMRYPGHVTLIVDHDLGRRPTAVLVYLAFDSSGGGSALSAGDLARIVEVTGDHVTIRNDTDGEYFVRLVLH